MKRLKIGPPNDNFSFATNASQYKMITERAQLKMYKLKTELKLVQGG